MSEVFRTARLIARHLCRHDVDAMLAVYGDTRIVRYAGDGQPLDREACARWVDVTLRNYATRGYGMFALVERASSSVIGFCGLVHPAGQPEAEIKYALRHEYWGRGLATEAAAALVGHAERLGLKKIIATIHPNNQASAKVLIKIGMAPYGLVRERDGTQALVFSRTFATAAGGATT